MSWSGENQKRSIGYSQVLDYRLVDKMLDMGVVNRNWT